jgi:hypothetical protein
MIQFDLKNLPEELGESGLATAANAVVVQLYKVKIPNIPNADPLTGGAICQPRENLRRMSFATAAHVP